MTLLTPELGQFTITNPVVYSEFDSDLDDQSLSFARRRMAERWDNENILDLTNIFEGKSVFVNMADILTPLAHDEIQKLAMADMPEEQRAEQWSRIHFPDLAYKTILIDNAHPEALVEQFKVGDEKLEAAGGNDLYNEIVDRIARVGVIVSPEQVKQALLVRYIKDSAALENVEAKYGIGGKFLSSIGNFYINQMTDPITALGDLFAFEMGGGIAESISKRYAIKGLGSKALRVVGEAAALGAKHVAIISGITNSRRADVGLPPISTAEAFAWDVFAGITLGAAFSGVFTDGAALLRNKVTAYAEKTLARRAVEVAQDAGGRYKHSTETDAELLARARDAVFSNEAVSKDKFKVDITFPRISDPSIPEINRAFNNSIGSVMNGTEFSSDVTGFFSARLSGWVGSMTPPELLLLSEGLAKANEYPKFYTEFIERIKLSDAKETFVKDLRKMIASDNEVTEYTPSKKAVIHNSGETERNLMGYTALYSNIETILQGAEEEALNARTFTSVRPDLSPENPYQSAVLESDIKLAADWERIRVESEAVIGKRQTFKPSDFLISSLESLNAYSANINALRAEFANKFAVEMSGIGSEELLSAWGDSPTSRASKIKNILNTLKDRLREVAKEYGITFGQVQDHIPQKWAQEKISASGFEKFQEDFLQALDIEQTKKAYNTGLQESLDKARFDLETTTKNVEAQNILEEKRQQKRTNTLLRDVARIQSKVKKVVEQINKDLERGDEESIKRANRLVEYLKKSEVEHENLVGKIEQYHERGIISNEKVGDKFISGVKRTQDQLDSVINKGEKGKTKVLDKSVKGDEGVYKSVEKAQAKLEASINELESGRKNRSKVNYKALRKVYSAQNELNRTTDRIIRNQENISVAAGNVTESLIRDLQKTQLRLYSEISSIEGGIEGINNKFTKSLVLIIRDIQELQSRGNTLIEKVQKNYEIESAKRAAASERLVKKVGSGEKSVEDLVAKIELNKTRAIARQEKKGETLIRNASKVVAELEAKIKAPFGVRQMRQIYDNIVTDNLLDPSTHTPKPTLKGSQRIMYFKDMKAFESLNRRYGVMPDFRVLVTRDLDSMIRDIGRLRAFSGSEEFFTENVESALKILVADRQLGFAERQLKNILDANINYVGGKFARETTMVNAWGRLYMSLIRNSALGGAGLTTFFDDAHSVAFAGSQNGFGFLRTIGEYVKGITKANLTTEEASRLLVALDDVSRGFDEEVYRYPTQSKVADISNVAQKIDEFTFKVNGVNYLTDRGRVTFNKLFLQELGAINAEKNPKMIETLSKYGINEKDFATIAEVPLDIDGVPLFNEEFKKTKTYEKVLRALYSESRKAVAATSQSLKAVMASEGYGGRALGIMNSLFFLKRIPMQVFFDKTLMPIYRGEYGEAAKFFAQNIIFTTARLTVKYLAMGYVPNFADPRFYREVLLQNAAMLPFLQPLFSMDRVDRFNVENALGSTFLGAYAPITDIAQLVTRDAFTDTNDTQLAKDIHRVIKDFAPLKSHPALGLMYERFIFDNIILAMDPEAYRTLAKAEQARTQAGKIKVF